MCIACCRIYAYVQPSCSQHYDKNAGIFCLLNQLHVYDITDEKNIRPFQFQIGYRLTSEGKETCYMQGWHVYTLEFVMN